MRAFCTRSDTLCLLLYCALTPFDGYQWHFSCLRRSLPLSHHSLLCGALCTSHFLWFKVIKIYFLCLYKIFPSLFNFSMFLFTWTLSYFFIIVRFLGTFLAMSGNSHSLLGLSIFPCLVCCDIISLVIDDSIFLVFMLKKMTNQCIFQKAPISNECQYS